MFTKCNFLDFDEVIRQNIEEEECKKQYKPNTNLAKDVFRRPNFNIPKDVFRKPNPRKEDFLPPRQQKQKMEIKNKTQSLPPLLPSGTMVTTLPAQQLHHHPSIPIQNIPPNTSEWGGVQHDSPNATTIIPHFNHNVPNHEVFHHQHQHRVMQNQQMNIYDNQRRKHLPNQNFNEEFELQPAPEHHQRPQYEHGAHQ